MKSNNTWRIRLTQIILGVALVIALVWVRGTKAGNDPIHLTTDWSHHHVVFSAPRSLADHVRLLSNPRYNQQLVRRNSQNNGGSDNFRWRRAPEPTETTSLMHRDWSVYLGSGGTVGANSYPAKYSFNPATATCATDFVVYNTGLSPNAAGTDATTTAASGIFKGNGSNIASGNTVTITNNNLSAPDTLVLVANTGVTDTTASGNITIAGAGTQPSFGATATVGTVTYTFVNTLAAGTNDIVRGGSAALTAGNLEAAINDNSAQCATAVPCFGTGIASANPTDTAALTGAQVNITARTDGASGNFSATGTGITATMTTTGGGANDGLNFLVSATTTTTSATNLAAAIQRSGASIGVGAAVTSGNTSGVTITSSNSGAGSTGGAVDISTASNMSAATNGFTAFSTPLSGGAAGASIVAYNNIYSSCNGGTFPTVYWAFDTGGTAATSPVLSGGGDQIAFVQNAGTTAELVLLRWATGGTVDAPTNITDAQTHTHTVTTANYAGCTAPCMTTLTMTAATTDTNSSPFYDYSTDTIYVGDNAGHLHAFTNAFEGKATPAEATHFPVTLTHAGTLTSPVFDDASQQVYVASSSGYLTSVPVSTGTQVNSNQLAQGIGFNDAPVLDSSNNHIYVITSDTLATTNNDSGIYAFSTASSINASNGTLTIISANNPDTPVYSGTFDNIWFNSANGTGNMYVCASAAATATPTLYKIVTAGVLGTVTTGPALTTATTPNCSPVSEFFNVNNTNAGANPTGTDLIFLSVTASGQTATPVSCSTNAGCLMSFDVTSGAALTTTKATVATIPATNGSSGIIVDGSATTTGASQVYYAPLTPVGSTYAFCTTSGASVIGGCGIQASQAGLN